MQAVCSVIPRRGVVSCLHSYSSAPNRRLTSARLFNYLIPTIVYTASCNSLTAHHMVQIR